MNKNYTERAQIVTMVIIGVLVIRLFVRDLFGLNTPKPVISNTPQGISTLTPNPIPSPKPISSTTPTPSRTPTPTPQPVFDKSFGNNYIASREAKKLKEVLNSAVVGFVTSIYAELDPALIQTSESEYLNSVTSIFLRVKVNNITWNSMNESQQKDVVVSMINSIHSAIGHGFPHVYINNGIRDVAEGSLSTFGEPIVRFK